MRRGLAPFALALALALTAPAPTVFAASEPPRKSARKPLAKPAEAKPSAEKPPEKPAPPTAPPYEPSLLRLSETLGALSFLRDLCGEGDGVRWRAQMQELVDAEGRDEAERGRLAGAFNRGYQDFALVYRACTPAARLALSRRLEEGAKLSRELAQRWGG